MIRCMIIDDEQPSINLLKMYIEKIPVLEVVGEAINPIEGIDMVTKLKPDVVFLDIQMYEMNGMDVARLIKGKSRIIFCTAYAEFAVESYQLDAVDFLQKPIEFERFEFAIQKLATQLSLPFIPQSNIDKGYQFIKTERGKMVKIDYDDIDYIKGLRNYVEFYCGSQRILAHYTLREVETIFPARLFCRVHKSYIIPINKITQIQGRQISLNSTGTAIPLSDHYRQAFFLSIGSTEPI